MIHSHHITLITNSTRKKYGAESTKSLEAIVVALEENLPNLAMEVVNVHLKLRIIKNMIKERKSK